jgi:hypothetical protein
MYSIKWGYTKARSRLDEIAVWALPSERFLLAMFMIEKLLRRTLVQIVISAGFATDEAFRIVGGLRGVETLKEHWKRYDPRSRTLVDVIGNDSWQVVHRSARKRNELVHGSGHEAELSYKRQLPKLLAALDEVQKALQATYGYSGWDRMKTRDTSALHRDPKVTV